MNEHTREDAKTQEAPSEQRGVEMRETEKAAFSRSVEFLKAGARINDLPPEALLRIAARIGNSNLLELLSASSRNSFEAVGTVPDPSAPRTNEEPNQVATTPLYLTEPLLSADMGITTRPFPISSLRNRAEGDTGRMAQVFGAGEHQSAAMQEGMANGAISD